MSLTCRLILPNFLRNNFKVALFTCILLLAHNNTAYGVASYIFFLAQGLIIMDYALMAKP